MRNSVMKSLLAFVVLAAAAPCLALAELKSSVIEHKQGDVTQKSYLVFDDAAPLPIGAVDAKHRPGVLVIPEWWGLNDYARMRADQLAKLGYVALAVDMYGDGNSTSDPKIAGQWATKVKTDRPLMRARVKSGLEVLEAQANVEKQKIGAIGFCFGGTTVLELAKSGADVKGVVCFHGGLDALPETDPQPIKAKILILHGAADPTSPPEQIAAFLKDLDARHADWQMVYYSGAKHAFTNKDADNLHMSVVGYQAEAEHRSLRAMQDFLDEVFK